MITTEVTNILEHSQIVQQPQNAIATNCPIVMNSTSGINNKAEAKVKLTVAPSTKVVRQVRANNAANASKPSSSNIIKIDFPKPVRAIKRSAQVPPGMQVVAKIAKLGDNFTGATTASTDATTTLMDATTTVVADDDAPFVLQLPANDVDSDKKLSFDDEFNDIFSAMSEPTLTPPSHVLSDSSSVALAPSPDSYLITESGVSSSPSSFSNATVDRGILGDWDGNAMDMFDMSSSDDLFSLNGDLFPQLSDSSYC